MAWLQKVTKPGARAPYRVKWREADGRERSRSFVDHEAAKRFLRDTESALDAGTYVAPDAGDLTLREWTAHTVESWNDLRPTTLARYETVIASQILPSLGDLPIGRVDTVVVQRWVNDLGKSGLSPATVRKAYQTLARIMRDAVVAKRVPFSPCMPEIRLPKVERHEARFLTPDEVKRLVDAIGPEWESFVWIGATCGLRIGEILALQWRDVDLLHSTITVRRNAVEANGVQHVGPTKTGAGRRAVPMPRVAVDALRARLERTGGGPGDLVFPSGNGTPWRSTNFRNRVWNDACTRAGLATWHKRRGAKGYHYDGLVPHELRHTAVSLWIAHGATLVEVTAWAGHENSAVLLKTYGHLFPTHGARVTAALDDAFADDDEATA